MACSTLRAGVEQLAAARPACHPLLPTTTCGLVAVSCTAKGRQMYGAGAQAVEAGVMHTASGQVGRGVGRPGMQGSGVQRCVDRGRASDVCWC